MCIPLSNKIKKAMKTLFSLAILFFSFKVFSQDSIILHSGQVIAGKVSEITQSEVKYRKAGNPDGPLYVISKNDISVIEYKNGSRDIFSQDNAATNSSQGNQLQAQQQQQYQQAQQPVQNNYYSTPRPNVNVVVAPPIVAPPVFGFGGYYPWGGFYRPYPRYYGGGFYGGYHHYGYGGGGYYHPHWHH